MRESLDQFVTRGADFPIVLDRGAPLHQALYAALRAAILAGRLGPGARLPSTRELARQLAIARGTVVAVCDRLRAEGYVGARPGGATAVAAALPDRWFAATAPGHAHAPVALAPSRWARSLAAPFRLAPAGVARPFRPHLPAVDAFPAALWGRLVARHARDERLLVADPDVQGHAPLRAALAAHLRAVRGVRCDAGDLVIVASAQQALDLIARVAIDPGQQIWVEDPGYVGARALFEAHGARCVPVPVDADGLRVDDGLRRAPDARLAFVTPGHQAPLGATMAIARRAQLLDWARARRAVIVEDDYDSEFRYEGRPVPALQGLDRAGVVVHVGTFSKTLVPSLRLAYLVVPPTLMPSVLAALSLTARYTPPLLQAALAELIADGHFARHLRRMRELYAGRREALLRALTEGGDRTLEVLGASAGLDVAVRLPAHQPDVAVVQRLAAHRIEAAPLSAHGDANGLVLGFAPFSEARLRRGVEVLREVLAAMPAPSGTAGRAARARAAR